MYRYQFVDPIDKVSALRNRVGYSGDFKQFSNEVMNSDATRLAMRIAGQFKGRTERINSIDKLINRAVMTAGKSADPAMQEKALASWKDLLLARELLLDRVGDPHTYAMRIHADKNAMLDWREPMSRQSPLVHDIIQSSPELREIQKQYGAGAQFGHSYADTYGPLTGRGLYQALANDGKPVGRLDYDELKELNKRYESASKFLDTAGIPGIKYADRNVKRFSDADTLKYGPPQDYVVFDPKRIEILRRFGIIGGATGAAAAATLGSGEAQAAAEAPPPGNRLQPKAVGSLAHMAESPQRDKAVNELKTGFMQRTENALQPFVNASDAAGMAYRDAIDSGVDPAEAKMLSLRATSDLSTKAYLEAAGIPAGIIAGVKGAARLAAAGNQVPAKTYDTAQAFERRGMPPDAIHQATGWWKGADGKWRFEIDDSVAAIGNLPKKQNMMQVPHRNADIFLPDVFTHPQLYNAYPTLRNTTVRPMDLDQLGSARGAYLSGPNRLLLAPGTAPDLKSVTLHEAQHGVQELEGFARGGRPEQFMDRTRFPETFATTLREQTRENMQNLKGLGYDPALIEKMFTRPKTEWRPYEFNVYSKLRADFGKNTVKELEETTNMWHQYKNHARGAFDKYENLAGEAEARLVQQRMNLTPTQRAEQFPKDLVPRDQQVITGPNGQPYRLVPVPHNPFE